MQILNKANKLIAVFLLLFGITFLFLSLKLPFGSFGNPKTGFMPKVFSIGMIIFSIINLFNELCKPDKTPVDLVCMDWKKVCLYFGSCILYVLLLTFFGYLPATLISLFLMIKFSGIKGYLTPILTTIGVTVFFYCIFTVVLHVPLPRGKLF